MSAIVSSDNSPERSTPESWAPIVPVIGVTCRARVGALAVMWSPVSRELRVTLQRSGASRRAVTGPRLFARSTRP